ncbi:hypothetical protein OG225_42915 (plasmid) [Nocardia sp. NBC_01377]|uniref:hypothetical protein n=1 Tax=Nocardia sp. NBC_01377 TaxID=2903595 RepID=UPI002F90A489
MDHTTEKSDIDDEIEQQRAESLRVGREAAEQAAAQWRAVYELAMQLRAFSPHLTRVPRTDDEEWWESHIPADLPFGQAEMVTAFADIAALGGMAFTAAAIYREQAHALGVIAVATHPPDGP